MQPATKLEAGFFCRLYNEGPCICSKKTALIGSGVLRSQEVSWFSDVLNEGVFGDGDFTFAFIRFV